jgi:hypothetical protein
MSQGDGDKRKVSTDALETLGTLIGPNEKRDAIHLAVLPVVAGSNITPGEDVKFDAEGLAVAAWEGDGIGIADPFLKLERENGGKGRIRPGQRFWLVVYPRKINSLRHVWTHPDIPDDAGGGEPTQASNEREESRLWLEAFANRLFSYEPDYGTRFEVLMNGAEDGGFGTDIEYRNDCQPNDEFWFHYERYTGRKVQERHEHFSCSC